jgi:hypothetical protein
MKKSLLLLGVIAALAIGAPAHSQYIFMDVNGDAANTTTDLLTSSTTSVDIYLDTNHTKAGAVVTCIQNASQPMDFFSYDMVVHTSGTGSISLNSYTNSASGFTQLNALTVAGSDAGVGYTAPIGGNLAPGRYKLGTFAVTVTGNWVRPDGRSASGVPWLVSRPRKKLTTIFNCRRFLCFGCLTKVVPVAGFSRRAPKAGRQIRLVPRQVGYAGD